MAALRRIDTSSLYGRSEYGKGVPIEIQRFADGWKEGYKQFEFSGSLVRVSAYPLSVKKSLGYKVVLMSLKESGPSLDKSLARKVANGVNSGSYSVSLYNVDGGKMELYLSPKKNG